jgi:tetratricopeptide (TPR) repeat protein
VWILTIRRRRSILRAVSESTAGADMTDKLQVTTEGNRLIVFCLNHHESKSMKCLILFLLAIQPAASLQDRTPLIEILKLNEAGSKLLSLHFADKDSVKKALRFFRRAIGMDSTYYLSYSNQANALCYLGEFDQALQSLDRALVLTHGYAEGITVQGFILERTGRALEAQSRYSKALSIYDERLATDPNNIDHKVDRAWMLLFARSKADAISTIEKIVHEHPDDSSAKLMKQVIYDFNRIEFIKSLWP